MYDIIFFYNNLFTRQKNAILFKIQIYKIIMKPTYLYLKI